MPLPPPLRISSSSAVIPFGPLTGQSGSQYSLPVWRSDPEFGHRWNLIHHLPDFSAQVWDVVKGSVCRDPVGDLDLAPPLMVPEIWKETRVVWVQAEPLSPSQFSIQAGCLSRGLSGSTFFPLNRTELAQSELVRADRLLLYQPGSQAARPSYSSIRAAVISVFLFALMRFKFLVVTLGLDEPWDPGEEIPCCW